MCYCGAIRWRFTDQIRAFFSLARRSLCSLSIARCKLSSQLSVTLRRVYLGGATKPDLIYVVGEGEPFGYSFKGNRRHHVIDDVIVSRA